MGMFDEIRCKMPLPVDIGVDHRKHWFQTKSLNCMLEYYEISEDGRLWKKNYEYKGDWDRAPASPEWVPCSTFIGEIVFYTPVSSIGVEDNGQTFSGWIEFSAYFAQGELKQLYLLAYDKPETPATSVKEEVKNNP